MGVEMVGRGIIRAWCLIRVEGMGMEGGASWRGRLRRCRRRRIKLRKGLGRLRLLRRKAVEGREGIRVLLLLSRRISAYVEERQ